MPVFDLAPAQSNDVFELRSYVMARSGSGWEQFIKGTVSGVPAQPIFQGLPMDSPYSATFSIKQASGTIDKLIPWRICSIGSVTVEGEGSQTATVGVEHTLHTEVDSRNLSLIVDLDNLASGDTVELRCKTRVLSGGATREIILGTYSGDQEDEIIQSIPIVSPYECIFTLKQTAGVSRVFDWRVDSF